MKLVFMLTNPTFRIEVFLNNIPRQVNAELQFGKDIIGWREKIALPDLGITEMKAKVDTGARTSALHALDLRAELHHGEKWISFRVPHLGEHRNVRHKARVFDERPIKNTSGIPQVRYIVRTSLVIGNRTWQIELSLTDRDKMKHDLILGRTALKLHKLLVAPNKSFLAGPPVFMISKDLE
jgi:hypothetical protein